MTGEQFLNSLRHLECEITALDQTRWTLNRTREDVLDRALSSPNLSGVCVQSSPGDKTAALGMQLANTPTPEQVVAKINALQERVNRTIDLLVDRKRIAFDVLDRMEDSESRALLILRYVNCLNWAEVTLAMGGAVRDGLLPAAVAAFSAIYESSV